MEEHQCKCAEPHTPRGESAQKKVTSNLKQQHVPLMAPAAVVTVNHHVTSVRVSTSLTAILHSNVVFQAEQVQAAVLSQHEFISAN